MEPEIKSAYCSYTYVNYATPNFKWENHKHKETVKTQILTVPIVLNAELKNMESNINISIVSLAAFNRQSQFVSDNYNEGTLIDIVSYSIKPIKNCIDIGDSLPATLVKMCEFQIGKSKVINLGGNENLNTFNYGTIQNFHTKMQEFEGKKFKQGLEDTVEYAMKICYTGNDRLNGLPYNIDDLTTLKCCKHRARIAIASIPFYGWFGGWNSCPDTLYKAPEAAKSSFGAEWSKCYKFTDLDDLEFEMSTEVRTVFASNDWETHQTNKCGDYLNWIKTVHKITQVLKIHVTDGIPSIEVIKREVKVLTSTGYNNQRLHRTLVLNENLDTLATTSEFHLTHRDAQTGGEPVDDLKKTELKFKLPV